MATEELLSDATLVPAKVRLALYGPKKGHEFVDGCPMAVTHKYRNYNQKKYSNSNQ